MWRDVNTLRARLQLVYFRLGKLQRVSKYVQQMWGIIGHVTVKAGSPVGTDGAPPQNIISFYFSIVIRRTCYDEHSAYYSFTICSPIIFSELNTSLILYQFSAPNYIKEGQYDQVIL